ncbi:annexin A6 [Rhinoraja longicauda]
MWSVATLCLLVADEDVLWSEVVLVRGDWCLVLGVAGEFFPEAAQVAYQIWELSATARVELRGAVRPAANFNVEADAKALRKAMKGLGTDEETLINIIPHRSNAQRQQLRQQFKSQLGRDLMADLKSEVGGNLQRVLLGLMMTPAQYDATQLQKAMKGAGTDERVLIEILTTRTNQEIKDIKEAYQEAYHKSLEDDLSSDTSGHFKRFLVCLVQGNREERDADLARAMEDAKLVTGYLELCSSSDEESSSMESKFISILCSRSYPHLRRVFQDYIKLTNKDIEQAIKNEMSGDLLYGLIAIVRSIKNKPSFFAERLYKSMKGAGTDDRTLTRILLSRSEIDLMNIRHEFKEMYEVSLYSFIESDTGGEYCTVLLALCGGDD